MKNCLDCKFALWEHTTAGKLHPSGDGQCQYQWKMPPLPAAMYWISTPQPTGGAINRKRDHKDHCAYFTREERK